jgi:hypothetical protein
MSADQTPDRPQSIRKVVVASLIGTSLEWYDFFLYASAAGLVFNKLFFPEADPLTGTLLAFTTSATGFVARAPSAGSSSATTATSSAARPCWW